MKATVLPEKQLRYVLKKQGFILLPSGDYLRDDCYFTVEMFDCCLKELDLTAIESHRLFHYRDEESRWLFNKDWFIPNSFKED